MMKASLLCILNVFLFFAGYSQNAPAPAAADTVRKHTVVAQAARETKAALYKLPVYKLKPGIDIPIIAAGSIWSAYALTKIYIKPRATEAQVTALKTGDINGFDRWAVRPYSSSIDKFSYYPFYAAIPFPLIYALSDNATRSDFFKITFLYWEAMSVTGLLGMTATYNVDRFRPYAYTTETDMGIRTSHIAKNSFYAGHVQVVATPTFFVAKVFADYHPDSKLKWVFYGIASVATGSMAYMRVQSGMHFPSDVLLGTATGVLAGILVPQYHKTKATKGNTMSVLPYSTGDMNGLVLTYHLNK
jgi:membrane-associated phospholipid phosphatase